LGRTDTPQRLEFVHSFALSWGCWMRLVWLTQTQPQMLVGELQINKKAKYPGFENSSSQNCPRSKIHHPPEL